MGLHWGIGAKDDKCVPRHLELMGGMHYHKNWSLPACRRLVAHGILWTLKLSIPKEGLPVEVSEADLQIR